MLGPGAPGSCYSHRVLAADVPEEPNGSLLMTACGQTRAHVGVIGGSIGVWCSR